MNGYPESDLQRILTDKRSGSSELLKKINLFFLKYINQLNDVSDPVNSLQSHFRSFQNIQHYLKHLAKIMDDKTATELFLREFRLRSQSVHDKIFSNALPFLQNMHNILTISNSYTVLEIIKRLPNRKRLRIFVSESRPGLEGRILAKKLNKEKIRAELITEAMSAGLMGKIDCVIIGADMVLKNKNVINKVGSLQLALLSKLFEKPFYVITERSKLNRKNIFRQKEESPDEIWRDAPEGISIKNRYFEIIRKESITKIITD